MKKRSIFKSFIFPGYNPDYFFSVVLYRGMLLYFIMNMSFSLAYWYSHLHHIPIDLLFLSIDVSREMPVEYLAHTFPRTLFVAFPASVLWIAGSAILYKKNWRDAFWTHR